MAAIGSSTREMKVNPEMSDGTADALGLTLFVDAMRKKLNEKRVVDGYTGWHRPEQISLDELESWLRAQLYDREKIDPVDIANYAMMVWNRRRMQDG